MADNLEILNLRTAQQEQVLDHHRMSLYNIELKFNLLLKILEEKGLFVKDEFNKRWPLYLKNDVGIMGPDGVMDGSLKITFYDN